MRRGILRRNTCQHHSIRHCVPVNTDKAARDADLHDTGTRLSGSVVPARQVGKQKALAASR